MDTSSGAAHRNPRPAIRATPVDHKHQPEAGPASTTAGAGEHSASRWGPAGSSGRASLVRAVDLQNTPQSSLASKSPRLPGSAADTAEGKGRTQAQAVTKQAVPDGKAAASTALDPRFAKLVPGVAALARKVEGLADVDASADPVRARWALAATLQGGFKALLRDVRLETDAQALDLACVLATAVEANFDPQALASGVTPESGADSHLRKTAIGLLLMQIQALRPVSVDRLADAILPQVKQPQGWVRGLLLSADRGKAPPPFDAMIARIVRLSGHADDPLAWKLAALSGLVQVQVRQMQMADDALKLSRTDMSPRERAAILSDAGIDAASPSQVRKHHERTLAQSRELIQLACEHARGLGPVALFALVCNLTAQIEQSALSGAKTLEVQAAALVRNVLVSAGIERELVVAVIQGLDRGVAVGRSPEEALAARTSIRQGMMQGLGSHYAELKIALRPLAGGYAGQEAEISRMVEASRTVLLAAVEREAPLASQ